MNTPFVVDRSDLGVLKFTGETRLDLLHRMSTQDLRGLGSGEGAATVLTTEIGRIIDRLLLYTTSDSVYVITGEGNNDNIARYLMRFVFFNDDFHIEDLTSDTIIFGVYGTGAGEQLASIGFPEVDLPLHHWRRVEIDGTAFFLHRTDPVSGEGYFVMAGMEDREHVVELLGGIKGVSAETFDTARIQSGLPRFGYELTNDYIPLETGLWDDVSFSKGCYIGQEIIARMESRGRLAKKLVRLQATAPLTTTTILSNGKNAGTITSAAGTNALGYVRTKFLDEQLQTDAGIILNVLA